jgi:hypothetical protein
LRPPPQPARLGELLYFDPNGWQQSSLGHIAVDIDGITYSWTPKGMHIEPTLDYLQRNSFRDAYSFPLRLSSKEVGQLEGSLQDYGRHHKYDIIGANCTDPLEDGLQRLGYPIARSLLPLGLRDNLVYNGLIDGDGYQFRPADPDKKRWYPNAPWSLMGGP